MIHYKDATSVGFGLADLCVHHMLAVWSKISYLTSLSRGFPSLFFREIRIQFLAHRVSKGIQ